MDINELTIGQAKELAAMFSAPQTAAVVTAPCPSSAPIPVIVCTDKRAVVFGHTSNVSARPITLTNARMCLYWSADVGGVFGLAEVGPTKGCKISGVVPSIYLEGVTAIMSVDYKAAKAWEKAPVQGR